MGFWTKFPPDAPGLPVDDTTHIVQDPDDNTKQARLDVGANSPGIVGVLATAFTTAKTVTLPDATTTLVGDNATQTLTNKTLATGNTFANAPTINNGVKFAFNPSTTNVGLNWGTIANDPSTLADGDAWYNTTGDVYRGRIDGATVDFATISASGDLNVVTTAPSATIQIEGDNFGTLIVKQTDGGNQGTLQVNSSAVSLGSQSDVPVHLLHDSSVVMSYDADVLNLPVKSTAGDPTGKSDGAVYYNSNSGKFRKREGGTWKDWDSAT